MLDEMGRFLFDIFFSLLGIAFILRAWMYAVGLPTDNSISQGVIQVTQWLIKPLSQVVQRKGIWDFPSLLGAWLAALALLITLIIFSNGNVLASFPIILLFAFLTTLKWAVNLLMWATLLLALMSWLNPRTTAFLVLKWLTLPFIVPIKRYLKPFIGGIDLSPLILFILTQLALIFLTRMSIAFMGHS